MKTYLALALAGLAAAHTNDEMDHKFIRYLAEHNKMYESVEEYMMRFAIFAEAEAAILANESNPDSGFTMAHNMFSDMTNEEFKQHIGFAAPEITEETQYQSCSYPMDSDKNWRKDYVGPTAVTDVKFAGVCGASWAFAGIGAIEGAHAIKSGELVQLSEQQIIDCDTASNGCKSGTVENVFNYAKNNSIMKQEDYPYKGEMKIFSPSCKADASKGVTTISDFKMVEANDANCLKGALESSPITVGVASSSWHFKLYKFGAIDSLDCGTELDHMLVATGYGSYDGTVAYIEMKNSWGVHWGIDGFVKIKVTEQGEGYCGVNKMPIQPIIN